MSIPPPDWHDSLSARCIGPRNRAVSLIVLHDTCGTGTHNDTRYLADPQDGRAVSVDFTVERDGAVWKLNPDLGAFCCYHAGRSTQWRGLANSQVNHASVGIELVQHEHLSLRPVWPLAQVDAVARLCAWLCDHFGLDEGAITTHAAVITDGSRDDPRQFPFPEFWELFRVAKNAGPHAAPAPAATPQPPAAPADPHPRVQIVRGPMSTFGGPEDTGVSPHEGLALRWGNDAEDPRLGAVFLSTQPPNTSGFARRLNPEARYIAMRWDYAVTSKAYLRTIMVRVSDPETGIGFDAFPVDWGPHPSTGRIADLSPGLARDLGLDTDDECEVAVPLP